MSIDNSSASANVLTGLSPSPTPTDPPGAQLFLYPRNIPIDTAEELVIRYNRRSIPIMDDWDFYHLINEVTSLYNESDKIEKELQNRLNIKSTTLDSDYDTAKYTFGLEGNKLFGPNRDLENQYRAGVCSHSVHGFQAFMAYCLPIFTEALLDRKKEDTKKNHKTKTKRMPKNVNKTSPPAAVTKPYRRSARIANRSPKPIK
jgi:hypothetical protein